VPDDFVSNVFWCAVTSIGQSNHRLVRKFKLFPWRLAVVSDSNSEESVKTKAATDFLTLNDCCLCEGFGQPLRELVGQDCSHLTGMQVHEQMSVHGNASSMAIGGQPEGQVNQAIVPADPRTTDSEGLGS
jgi:hypothetical protein